ncbi:uncharacterized protein [Montipora capricornis]|uniref:uncharacterized protein n=1 Tax=Montipora capricornis TaxID=246305 RepID=UPI0035F1665B
MPTAFSTSHYEELREYEQVSRAKQKEFMERYEFHKVPIRDPSGIQAGDHLIRRENSYDHHMLCTGTYTDQIKIIEYTGHSVGISAVSSSVASKDATVFGKIKEQSYSVKEFLEKKILKVIWPPELERFSVTEVIERARSRINETCYDFLKNNCEHFVTWCKSGLNVSLQVKTWYPWAREVLYSAFAGLYQYGKKKAEKPMEKSLVPLLIKIASCASDEVACSIRTHAKWVGIGIGILLEVGLASYEIYKAFKYHGKTRREFWSKFVDIVAKAACRLGGGVLGSWLGPIICPAGGLAASLVGGAVGAGLGHFVGASIAWLFENWAYFDG